MCKGKSALVTGLNYNRHRPTILEIQGERHIPTRWILVVFWIDQVTGSTQTLVGKWFNISRFITICLHWYVIRWVLKMRTLPTFKWPIKRYPQKKMSCDHPTIWLPWLKQETQVMRQEHLIVWVLAGVLFMCIYERVVVILNTLQHQGLWNGLTRVLCDIVYKAGD